MAVPARRLPRERRRLPRRVSKPGRSPSIPLRPSRRRGRVPFVLFSLLMVAATVVGLVSAQTMVAQESFRVADLSARAVRLEAGYGELRLKVAELSSPDRIVAAARRAGLVLPEEVEILRLPAVRDPVPDPNPQGGAILALKGVLGGTR